MGKSLRKRGFCHMQSSDQIQSLLQSVYQKHKDNKQGKPASYIPELAKANSNHFGLAVVTTDGRVFKVGDSGFSFTMQSTSKPFLYGLALSDWGSEHVHSKVGVEPTGEAFNSIIELEEKSHRPFNPMINSGAIATTSLVKGENKNEKFQKILNHFETYVTGKLQFDENVFKSESATAHRNRAISYLMKYFEVLDGDIEETLEIYFKQCSILVNAENLACMAATLANQGKNPLSKKEVLKAKDVTRVLSLMFTCGMYDSAGDWAFHVGLPAKSGVSGAILAVAPGKLGIAGFSPNIDEKGHSYRVSLAIQDFAEQMNLNIFTQGSLS